MAGLVPALVPVPASVAPGRGTFELRPAARVVVAPASAELRRIGEYLVERLAPATGYRLAVTRGPARPGDVVLTTAGTPADLGREGYELDVSPEGVRLAAHRPAGLFRGVQTLRQLLPPAIESREVQPGPWRIRA